MAGVVTFTGLNPAGTLSGGEIVAVTQSGSSVRTTITAIQNFITSALTTSSIAEGTNQYFTQSRVLNAILSGFSSATNSVVLATDSLLVGIGKLQAQITSLGSSKVSVSTLGVASGTATLDGTGYLTNGQIPPQLVGGMNYQGLWNASTNTPTLTSGAGTKGYIYKVSVAGTTSLNGNNSWNVGDMAVYNGTSWDHWDGVSAEVVSVAGRTGNVVLAYSDITGTVPTWNQNTTGTAATVTVAAQPNITSVGTLTGLTVGADATIHGVTVGLGGSSIAHNLAVGIGALSNNTSGDYNQATGTNALAHNTAGQSNSGTGVSAILSNTTGGYNTGTGCNSLYSNTTGSYNTAIGLQSGYTLTPANANVTGTYNTWLGANSGPGTTTQLSNSTAIGYGALNLNSNEMVLGNSSLTSVTTTAAITATGGFTGTLNTAAQPNITSVGTLGSLAVTGALSSGAVISSTSLLVSNGGSAPITSVSGSGSSWYNSIIYNNGSSTYFLSSSVQTTQAAANTATFNALRPFSWNLANGAVSVDGTGSGTTFGGAISSPSAQHNHLVGGGSAPTISVGTGAGTSPTVSISGTDLAFKITLTTGTLPTASATVCTVTFNTAYTASPHPHLTPASANAALLSGVTMVWPSATTTTYALNSGTTGLTAATTYVWECDVIQ